jgi:hypothetical protein
MVGGRVGIPLGIRKERPEGAWRDDFQPKRAKSPPTLATKNENEHKTKKPNTV